MNREKFTRGLDLPCMGLTMFTNSSVDHSRQVSVRGRTRNALTKLKDLGYTMTGYTIVTKGIVHTAWWQCVRYSLCRGFHLT